MAANNMQQNGGGWCLKSYGLGTVAGQAEAAELPAGGGAEEVAIGGADVSLGCDAGAAAEDDLGAHELAVVLAQGAGEGLVAGVAGVGGLGPLPDVAEELLGGGGGGAAGLGVEVAGFQEVARDGMLGGDELPFELGGEAVAGPAGEGVGFEEAEVADGGFGEVGERLPAVEGEDAPEGGVGGVATPVEGGLPALRLDGVPAFGEPELGTAVAVGFDEGEVFGTHDGAGGEAEGREIDGVAGRLVVKGKDVKIVGIGSDADLDDAGVRGRAGGEAEPFQGRGDDVGGLAGGGGAVGGVEGVGEEGVLDVGGGELEVLLLVLEAEGDGAEGLVLGGVLEEAADGGVDVGAVGEDLVERGTGEGGAKLLLWHLAEGAVVAVEEPLEVGVEGLVAGDVLGEDEGFKEPGGVGEVPLDRGGLGAGLHHHVLGGEGRAKVHGGLSNGPEAVEEGYSLGEPGGEVGLLRRHNVLQSKFDTAWRLDASDSGTCCSDRAR